MDDLNRILEKTQKDIDQFQSTVDALKADLTKAEELLKDLKERRPWDSAEEGA